MSRINRFLVLLNSLVYKLKPLMSMSVVEAIRAGWSRERVARTLTKIGKDAAHIPDKDLLTPLHVASDLSRLDIVTLLIDKYKAEINAIDKNGWTPLHFAASSGHLPTCEYLLEKGAFARALSNEGASPLHYLVRHSPADPVLYHKVFQLMIKKGADVNQQNKHGEAPLHQAAQRGREPVVLFLLNYHAQVNITTKYGETCLHFAVRADQKGVVQLLLQMGADPLVISTMSGTPLDLADAGHPDIAEIFKKFLKSKDIAIPSLGGTRLPDSQSRMSHSVSSSASRDRDSLEISSSTNIVWDNPLENDEVLDYGFISCVSCTKECHANIEELAKKMPLHFHTKAPQQWLSLTLEEEQQGILELKKVGKEFINDPASVCFGVWVKVAKKYFDIIVANWNKTGREKDTENRFMGDLANSLVPYPDTMNLKVMLVIKEKGKRPSVEVQPTDHPLSSEQRNGVSTKRVCELIHELVRSLHGESLD